MNVKKCELRTKIKSFICQFALVMIYIATGMKFYLNTLSDKYIFRKDLTNLFQSIIRIITRRLKYLIISSSIKIKFFQI
jgi:hypothetical protein